MSLGFPATWPGTPGKGRFVAHCWRWDLLLICGLRGRLVVAWLHVAFVSDSAAAAEISGGKSPTGRSPCFPVWWQSRTRPSTTRWPS